MKLRRSTSRNTSTALFGGLVLFVAVLCLPALYLNASQYQAFAGGLQALGVVLALVAAAATIASDRTDRRVDRVLRLQEELLGNDLYNVRLRLVAHLRAGRVPGQTRRVSLRELSDDPGLSKYDGIENFDPRNDARRLLQFFQKANAARLGNIVAVPLFHELIGRQATWEAMALSKDPDESSLAPLLELADWANYYAARYPGRTQPAYIQRWGTSRQYDFGEIYRTQEDLGNVFRKKRVQ